MKPGITQYLLDMPTDLHSQVKAEAASRDTTIKALILKAIEASVESMHTCTICGEPMGEEYNSILFHGGSVHGLCYINKMMERRNAEFHGEAK